MALNVTISPLKAGMHLVFDTPPRHDNPLTRGKVYTVLEDEVDRAGWRIIRVTCDDGVARRVPPQFFRSQDGKLFGCRECFDRGVIHGGEDQGEFIRKCRHPGLNDATVWRPAP